MTLDPTIVGLIVLACTFAGALLGMWLRTALPEHQFDAESRDTVKVGIGLIAMMTALVLGLVTASAKSSFDAVDAAVKQSATQVLALDRALARYGSDTSEIRNGLQRAVGARIDAIWPQGSSKPASLDPTRAGTMSRTEGLADAIRGLKPQDDSQRTLQARALDLAESLLQARWIVLPAPGRQFLCRSLRSSCSGSHSRSRASDCLLPGMPWSSRSSSFVHCPLVAPCSSYWSWMGRSTACSRSPRIRCVTHLRI